MSLTFIYPPGGAPITNPNGAHLRVDAQWLVNFDQFTDPLPLTLSFDGQIAAALLQGGVSVWASTVSGDNSGTGELLAILHLPQAGTVGFLHMSTTVLVPNPGGTKYLILTSIAGENGEEGGFLAVPLTYKNATTTFPSAAITHTARCATLKKLMPPTYRLEYGDPITEVLCVIGQSDNAIGGLDDMTVL